MGNNDAPTMFAEGTPGWPRVRPGDWDPLGVTLEGDGANVAVWAEGADRVDLCLFDDDGTEHRVELRESTFHMYTGRVSGIVAGQRYGFRVHGPWDPARGARWNANKLLADPYARAIDGNFTLNPAVFGHVDVSGDDTQFDSRDSSPFVPRSVVVHDSFDWANDAQPRVPWSDTIIYEAHVKGMTAMHPAVPEHERGTYAGLAHDAVIEHLLSLGVTSVELLPVHHSVSEVHLLQRNLTNYWGYNTLGYFAPHAAYSSTGSRGQQVAEFQAMVKKLHSAGLEVILDVVYNHTCEANQIGPTLVFRGIDNPAYYHLLDGDPRRYADYTGCGNTLDVSHPHVLQLVMDSLRYWVEVMHVDGFRFDLASALARSFHDVDMLGPFMQTLQQDPVLRRVKLIAEPWDVGAGGYQVGEFPALWTEWNDKFRDTLRDYWRGDEVGIGDLGWRLTGSADLYWNGRRPYSSINFVTAHDGFTLRDLYTYNGKHNEANGESNRDGTDNNRSWNCGVEGETDDAAINEMRHRLIRNQLVTLVLSSGVPMIVAGDEFGRTQHGNNNAYCQDNEISWIDWNLDDWQESLLDFSRRVVQLRHSHRVFRQRHFFEGKPVYEGGPKDLGWFNERGIEYSGDEWHDTSRKTVGMYLSGYKRERDANGAPIDDSSFLIYLNASAQSDVVTLPGAPWGERYDLVLESAHTDTGGMSVAAGDSFTLAARSTAVFRVSD